VFRIEQSVRSSLRRPKLPTKGGSAPEEEEEGFLEEIGWCCTVTAVRHFANGVAVRGQEKYF